MVSLFELLFYEPHSIEQNPDQEAVTSNYTHENEKG